ncbi:MAG: branched-chain amino acid ABC transporter permease [Dehalococcoidales bacterium]|nr:branched-chain amino acid ABC transporter permease [Dehalococcoidales bacterium]
MSRKLLITITIAAVLAAVIIILPLALNSVYWTSILVLVGINILIVSSLRTIKLLGHISLGHVGFSLIGAYGSGLLAIKLGLSVWLTIFLGGLIAAILALVLSYPFLKVKGMYFALLTLLTAETLRLITWYWKGFTGGFWGLLKIPSPGPITIAGLTIDFDKVNNYYYMTAVVVAISLFVLYRLENSHLGFKWKTIQDTDVLAQSVGINVKWHKMLNFTIACFFAGIAGALFAHFQHSLSPDANARFGVLMSIYLVVYMVVGGESKFSGPIIGTVALSIISELARGLGEYRPMMIGAIAIIFILLMPEGLVGLPNRCKLLYRKLLRLIQRGSA